MMGCSSSSFGKTSSHRGTPSEPRTLLFGCHSAAAARRWGWTLWLNCPASLPCPGSRHPSHSWCRHPSPLTLLSLRVRMGTVNFHVGLALQPRQPEAGADSSAKPVAALPWDPLNSTKPPLLKGQPVWVASPSPHPGLCSRPPLGHPRGHQACILSAAEQAEAWASAPSASSEACLTLVPFACNYGFWPSDKDRMKALLLPQPPQPEKSIPDAFRDFLEKISPMFVHVLNILSSLCFHIPSQTVWTPFRVNRPKEVQFFRDVRCYDVIRLAFMLGVILLPFYLFFCGQIRKKKKQNPTHYFPSLVI